MKNKLIFIQLMLILGFTKNGISEELKCEYNLSSDNIYIESVNLKNRYLKDEEYPIKYPDIFKYKIKMLNVVDLKDNDTISWKYKYFRSDGYYAKPREIPDKGKEVTFTFSKHDTATVYLYINDRYCANRDVELIRETQKDFPVRYLFNEDTLELCIRDIDILDNETVKKISHTGIVGNYPKQIDIKLINRIPEKGMCAYIKNIDEHINIHEEYGKKDYSLSYKIKSSIPDYRYYEETSNVIRFKNEEVEKMLLEKAEKKRCPINISDFSIDVKNENDYGKITLKNQEKKKFADNVTWKIETIDLIKELEPVVNLKTKSSNKKILLIYNNNSCGEQDLSSSVLKNNNLGDIK